MQGEIQTRYSYHLPLNADFVAVGIVVASLGIIAIIIWKTSLKMRYFN